MLNPNEQIALLLEKIKEKENSQDKLDLWLVKHWAKEIEKLKYETILTENIKGLNANR